MFPLFENLGSLSLCMHVFCFVPILQVQMGAPRRAWRTGSVFACGACGLHPAGADGGTPSRMAHGGFVVSKFVQYYRANCDDSRLFGLEVHVAPFLALAQTLARIDRMISLSWLRASPVKRSDNHTEQVFLGF